jgi:ABC-2 type transport system permease protein
MRNISLVAKREFKVRVFSKSFVFSTILFAILIVAVAGINGINSSGGGFGNGVSSLMIDDNTKAIADANQQAEDEVLQQHGLTKEQFNTEVSLKSKEIIAGLNLKENNTGKTMFSFVILMLMFMSIILTGNQMASGVVEEKSNSVVEILLSAMSSFQLLTGKIIGLACAGLIQIIVIIIALLVSVEMSGGGSIFNGIPIDTFGLVLFMFAVVGYISCSSLYAAFASTASSPSEAQTAVAPVAILMIIPFYASIFLQGSSNNPVIGGILHYCPFFSIFSIPVDFAKGLVTLNQSLISLTISIIAIPIIFWFASKLYNRSILS